MPLPRYRIALSLAFLSLAVVLTAGCGAGTTTLEGQVSFGGQPVDGGAIVLIPQGSKDVATGARIVGGKYVITAKGDKLPPGTYKVQINWLKPTGKKVKNDDEQLIDETQEVIPMEYNQNSKLTVEIKSSSNNQDFELKAGGPVAGQPVGGKGGKNVAD